ncbi:MAG: MBL fold metallo-hydrolase [Trueperaceae bacterium]|nr:MBL fold metallo-hydrolase [Trueperaceae bacterium]
MAASEVVPGLVRIPLGYVNAYALLGSDSVTLIDTGMPGRHEQVLAALAQFGCGAEDVTTIVITHLHVDHTGGLRALRERTGARVYAHPVDARAIREGVSLRRIGPEGTWLGRVVGLVGRYVPMFTADAADVDVEVEDGATLDATVPLEVVHAPGHSAGQIALLWREHGGVLIAGDAATQSLQAGPAAVLREHRGRAGDAPEAGGTGLRGRGVRARRPDRVGRGTGVSGAVRKRATGLGSVWDPSLGPDDDHGDEDAGFVAASLLVVDPDGWCVACRSWCWAASSPPSLPCLARWRGGVKHAPRGTIGT